MLERRKGGDLKETCVELLQLDKDDFPFRVAVNMFVSFALGRVIIGTLI